MEEHHQRQQFVLPSVLSAGPSALGGQLHDVGEPGNQRYPGRPSPGDVDGLPVNSIRSISSQLTSLSILGVSIFAFCHSKAPLIDLSRAFVILRR